MSFRIRKFPLVTAGVAVVVLVGVAGVAVASSPVTGNDWPYAGAAKGRQYTLAAVGDIACEPDDAENASTPASLKCGSPSLGGYDAEYATAQQAVGFRPDAVALLGDEQYEVGKLSDFEGSFEQAWGGLKFLETSGARQPRVLQLHQEGRQRARAERDRLLRLLQRPRPGRHAEQLWPGG